MVAFRYYFISLILIYSETRISLSQPLLDLPLHNSSGVIIDNDDHRDVYTEEFWRAMNELASSLEEEKNRLKGHKTSELSTLRKLARNNYFRPKPIEKLISALIPTKGLIEISFVLILTFPLSILEVPSSSKTTAPAFSRINLKSRYPNPKK